MNRSPRVGRGGSHNSNTGQPHGTSRGERGMGEGNLGRDMGKRRMKAKGGGGLLRG